MKKFNDYNKYFVKVLQVYVFVLFLIGILRLIGLDCFNVNIENKKLLALINYIDSHNSIKNLLYLTHIMIYQYFMISLSLKINSNKLMVYTIKTLPFTLIMQGIIKPLILDYFISIIVEILYLFLVGKVYAKLNKIDFNIKRFIRIMIMSLSYQVLVVIGRLNFVFDGSVLNNMILNIDYLVLMFLTYITYFTKGEDTKCLTFQMVVGSFLEKLTQLRKLPRKLQKNFQNNYNKFKTISRKDKIFLVTYLTLLTLWNTFTVVLIVFVSFLNNTLIECLFILTSFWTTKSMFGKPFHLKNLFHCFIVSNLTYYCLNRITLPIGISIIAPIILGVGLSYVTSKLVVNKKLYRGMPENEFYETISLVTNNKLDIEICRLFYCERKKEDYIARITNYSKESVQKHKRKINNLLNSL